VGSKVNRLGERVIALSNHLGQAWCVSLRWDIKAFSFQNGNQGEMGWKRLPSPSKVIL